MRIKKIFIVFVLLLNVLFLGACVSQNVKSIVSIEKAHSEGLTDIYVITYSDGTTSTFTIKNGEKGDQGEQGIQGEKGDQGEPGKDGKPGNDAKEILDVRYVSSEGIMDTYEIVYKDGSTTTFTIANSALCNHDDKNYDDKCDTCLRPFHENHVDKNDNLKCDICGKDYDDGPCTDHKDDDKNCLCDYCSKSYHLDNDSNGYCDKCNSAMGYYAKWQYNSTGFNGQGMTVKIKVANLAESDPFSADYIGPDQEFKMKHQQLVQQAYNVKIEYVDYTISEAWGPRRITAIIDGYTNGSYQKDDIYVVDIVSSWIPQIVKTGALAELGEVKNGDVISGILAEYSDKYVQNSTINEVASASNKLYGISTSKPTPDHFMYYNIDLVETAQVEDPAEMWLRGEWTVTEFEKWVANIQTALPEGKYALDLGFPEFAIGLVASTGNQFVTISPIQRINFLDDGVISNIEIIQELYANGYYVPGRGTDDYTKEFMEGESIMASGQLWYINDPARWDSKANKLNIGVVPYPAADDDNIVVETTSDASQAVIGANGEPLAYNGEYVSGLNLENAKFKIPYSSNSASVYSILDYANGKNGINATVIANILIDLYAGYGYNDPELGEITKEQEFKNYLETLFDRPVDVEVVMSVYDRTYFEIFEDVSMTVGGGSQFGPNGFWPICAALCKSTDDPYTKLSEIYEPYRQAMIDMGYNPL